MSYVGTFFYVTQPLSGTSRVAAAKLATSLGISLTNECPWIGPPDADGFTPFGPDSRLDNIYQSLPQVTLHGMDEGLTLKLVDGVMNTIIAEAVQLRGMSVTSVRVWQVFVSNCNASISFTINVQITVVLTLNLLCF